MPWSQETGALITSDFTSGAGQGIGSCEALVVVAVASRRVLEDDVRCKTRQRTILGWDNGYDPQFWRL